MPSLKLEVLGTAQVSLGDKSLTSFRTKKVLAVLIYLLNEQKPHERKALMDFLWPGLPGRSAQSNLRQIIFQLRKVIPEVSAKKDPSEMVPLLSANRINVGLNPAADVAVDALQLESLVAATLTHPHADLSSCADCHHDLEKAAGLYRDHFLAEFYLDDSEPFEEWAQAKRESYRRKVLDALEVLAGAAIRESDLVKAKAYADRQIEIDHLHESAYRQMMQILALGGQREAALATFKDYRRMLAEELGMGPGKRTVELYEKIKAGDLSFDAPAEHGVRGFELQGEIGEGAFGTIHLAQQPSVGRQVVVKVIRQQYANDPEFIRRFENEAQTVARLEHPFIVPLYDYWRDPDGAYLVMRYLRGGSLLTALEPGPWQADRAARMLDQVAGALSAAHRQGVVHRDIKPANILLDEEGNSYLSDFGIAKDLSDEARLTATGAVVGTLDYISPEQILNDELTGRADIYSLGAVLYETLTGEKPFPDSSVANLLHSHLKEPMPPVSASRPDLSPQVDEVVRRATAKQATDRYSDALEMAEAFRRAIAGLDVGDLKPAFVAEEAVYNPYKGLRAFQETDAEDFHGREALVTQLVSRLADSRFLVVVGPSGSGKSSAVKAGLIPALREGIIPAQGLFARSDKWFLAEMVPGAHPLQELETALWPIAVDPPDSLVEPMRHDTQGLSRTIRRILPNEAGAQILLVIDQFEELFTLVEDEEEREFFIDSLLMAIRDPRSPMRVVITLRADFYDRPLQVQTLGRLVKENSEVILPLSAEELTWAIREPARRVGVGLEGGLTEAIVADVIEQPGALPLLQYALTELFDRRQDRLMTQIAYQEIGGVTGALGRRADEIYGSLDDVGQEATRQLFLRLVTLGEGVEDTRRRVLRSEIEGIGEKSEVNSGRLIALQPPVEETPIYVSHSQFTIDYSAVIDVFGTARLLTFDHDPVTRAPTVEVAHEALLREWERLRNWLDESRNDVRMQRMLAQAADDWAAAGQDSSYLLRGSRLEQFAGWVVFSTVALTVDEQQFLDASMNARAAREAEEEARRQRELETAQRLAETESARAEEQAEAAAGLRRRAYILGGVLALAVLLAIAAIFFAQQSNENANLATTREAEALAEANQRATAQAQAEEERIRADSEREIAVTAQAEAQANAEEAQEQQFVAEQERAIAQEQAALARSRELAGASVGNLDRDPELSLLLALEGLYTAHTVEAENALHQATLASRVRQRLVDVPQRGWQVTYSPDGRYKAKASYVSEIATIWDTLTGEVVIQVPYGFVDNGLEFSADSSQIAVLDPGEMFNLSFFEIATGEKFSTLSFPVSTDDTWDYELDPAWTQIAINPIDENGTTGVWDLNTGELLYETAGHDWDYYTKLHYSQDGSLLLSIGGEKAIVTDASSGQTLLTLEHGGGDGQGSAFSADGKLFAVRGSTDGSNDQMKVWRLESNDAGTPVASLKTTLIGHGNLIFDSAFSPDGNQIATISRDSTARIWDPMTGEELLVLPHGTQLVSVAFNEDGTRLLTGDFEGAVREWDITPQGAAELFTFAAQTDPVQLLVLSPDGERLVTSRIDDTFTYLVWDSSRLFGEGDSLAVDGDELTMQSLSTLTTDHTWRSRDADFSPDGSQLATVGADGSGAIWDIVTGERLSTLEGHEDGNVGGLFDGVLNADYGPDGSRLVTAGADATARIWDAKTGEELMVLTGHEGGLTNAIFNPDGSLVATSSDWPDANVRIWDASTGQELFSIPADHSSRVFGLDFSPDGKWLATSGSDSTAKVWLLDLEEKRGHLLTTLVGHTSTVGTVLFSPDSKTLATTSGGGDEVKLWDVSGLPTTLADSHELTVSAPEILSLTAEIEGPARVVSFGPYGQTLIVGLSDGTVRVYALDVEQLMAIAEGRLTRTFTADECRIYRIEPCPAEDS